MCHVFLVSGIPTPDVHAGQVIQDGVLTLHGVRSSCENTQNLQPFSAIRTGNLTRTKIWPLYHSNIPIWIGIALICTNCTDFATISSSWLPDHSVSNQRKKKPVGLEHRSDFKVEKFTKHSPGMKERSKIL